ncbi:MAG: class I SAM-dependent methyltransferase [Candidatus Midichloria sp.]|nr:class I SAM-dependent methyltransferase [Candidatus Midichloria sp.]
MKGNKVAPQFLMVDEVIKAANSAHGKSLGNNVLDMGCGTGTIGQLLRESRIANAVVGVDISKKC